MDTSKSIIAIVAELEADEIDVEEDWDSDEGTTLDLSRELSRGRRQHIGTVTISDDGEWDASMSRRRGFVAGIIARHLDN